MSPLNVAAKTQTQLLTVNGFPIILSISRSRICLLSDGWAVSSLRSAAFVRLPSFVNLTSTGRQQVIDSCGSIYGFGKFADNR
jgi:hypothetical protein